MEAAEPKAIRALVCEALLVGADIEWRAGVSPGGLHLQESFLAFEREGKDVVASAVAILPRDPADFSRQVLESACPKAGVLGSECQFLPPVAMVPGCATR